ncbi:hypothetical protein DAEQUDRAFT_726042 [Daedalea quercina L-15889]|uniref:Thiaminase-2/PQQC domain-containing protein n=1 Tax=Daedalea quercina L-15889 TaxID=1314783 RepID=A0A165QXA9_9APHY|nr:hypothetical protein DAEQUDRAFT_726042 [Daedalea quercina L-15889]
MSLTARANLVSARPRHASRVKDAFDELNKYAASPKHGASLEQIKAVDQVRKSHPVLRGAVADDDLVGRLINDPDNQDLWFNQLLGNKFCRTMGTTGPSDPGAAVLLKGFEAYMVQDYIYCARGIFYQTQRAMSSTSTEEFDETADKASRYCTYAQGALHLCVYPVDQGLGMNDTSVLQTKAAPVTDSYTKFQFETARDYNWVMGLVAMIPCIQSYYALANPLYKNATDKVKRTSGLRLLTDENAHG